MPQQANQNLPTPVDPAMFANLDPDTILPEQFFPEQPPQMTGELSLLWAVFADGIASFRKEILAGTEGSESFQETLDWVDRQDGDSVFGFESLCETFGMRPDCVRDSLMIWKTSQQRIQQAA